MKKILLTLLLTGGAAFSAPISFLVTVNTGPFSGTGGALDFQYNPGPSATQASTATISGFTPTATLAGPQVLGSVSGALTSSVAINNTTSLNEYFINYTFPSTILFNLTFSGPALDNPSGTGSGSAFGFSLYNAAGDTPLGSSNIGGFLFTFNLTNQGALSNQSFTTGGTGVSIVLATPEPATLFLFPVALGAIALLRRKRLLA